MQPSERKAHALHLWLLATAARDMGKQFVMVDVRDLEQAAKLLQEFDKELAS